MYYTCKSCILWGHT